MNILQWIHNSFSVESVGSEEVVIQCPVCNRPKLYFNISKRIGHCHYDKCRFHVEPVTLTALSAFSPFGTDVANFPLSSFHSVHKEKSHPPPVKLPNNAKPLITINGDNFCSLFPTAVDAVAARGVMVSRQFRYNLHFDGLRVYIPVYYQGKMVSYVGRAAWWFYHEYPRYMYPKGAKVTDYFFDWDERSKASNLVLVENTFNAILYDVAFGGEYRQEMGVTTNFGSHLSDNQLKLLEKSSVQKLVILWDGGAHFKALKAVEKLRNAGIQTLAAILPNNTQPDDFSSVSLYDYVLRCFNELDKGRKFLRYNHWMKS